MTARTRLRRLATAAVATVAGVSLLSACNLTNGLYGVSLPGGANTGSHPLHVNAVFDNVSDLVPQAAVKVNDVTVGTITGITLTKDMKALVKMRLQSSVHLPANAVASLSKTSLLGERFVELAPPSGGTAQGQLRDNATISNGNTGIYPDVEEVFGALSALLNGGGLQNLQTINYELGQALSGRENKVRDLLNQLDRFVSGLDKQKSDIIRALEATDRLTTTLNRQKQTIATALDDLGPGIKVIADNRAQLVSMLTALSRLGVVGSRIIKASKDNTIADFRALVPILSRLKDAGTSLPRSLELLLTYPFPRHVVDAIPGDLTNLYATVDLTSFGGICAAVQLPACVQNSSGVPGLLQGLLPKGTPALPNLPKAPSAPSVPVPTPSLNIPHPLGMSDSSYHALMESELR